MSIAKNKRFFNLKKVNFRQQKTVSKKQFDIIQNSSHKRHESSQAKILEEITAAIAAFVRSENSNNNVTHGFFDTLGEISESVQKDFEEQGHQQKYLRYVTYVSKNNANVNSVDKNRKAVKTAIETTLKI